MNDIASYLFYIGIFAGAALLLRAGYRYKSMVLKTVAAIIPIIVAALRDNVGTDYATYVKVFEDFRTLSIGDFFSNRSNGTEVGFYLINKLSQWLTDGPGLMFAIMSIICIVFFFRAMRRWHVRYPALVYFLYLMLVFPNSLNIVRQSAAAMIALYAFSFILEKKPVKYVFAILCASSLHTSALFLLPLYLVRFLVQAKRGTHIRFAIKTVLIALIIGGVLPLLIAQFSSQSIFSRYSIYDNIIGSGINLQLYVHICFVVIFTMILRYRYDDIHYRFFYVLEVLNVILLVNLDPSQITKRLAVYFSIAPVMLLDKLPSLSQSPSGRRVMMVGIVCYGLVIFYISYVVLMQADIIPYKSMLFGGSS